MRRYVIGDVLKIQCSAGTKCVYAFTGDADAQATVSGLLEKTGLSDDVTLVSRKSQSTMQGKEEDDASAAAEATVVAGTACAIAETFALEDGEDVLVVVDTIDQHKKLWDATTRVLVDVFGVDSVVKSDRDGGASSEMRAFFSSLIQRSAQFKADRGGGSVTLLLLQSIPMLPSNGDDDSTVFTMDDFEGVPDKIRERLDLLIKKNIPLTAATLRKIQIPVPSVEEGRRRLALQHVDDLISMSDGQIWLDETLENAGRRPAFDFQRSVTRVGIGADTNSRADAPAMRRVVEGLRLVLSQAQSMDGAEVGTDASRKQMRNAAALLLAMHQPSGTGARKLSESCVALLAASTGALNGSIDSGIAVGSEDGTLLIRKLLDHVHALVPQAMQEIDTTQDFSDETKATISAAIQSFFDSESS
jgi:F0F1-type ATP synthase alpha subunit